MLSGQSRKAAEIQETDNRGELWKTDTENGTDAENVEKQPECFWVKLLFGIIKTIVNERKKQQTLQNTEIEELRELTRKIVKLSKDKIRIDSNMCDLRYKYIMGAAQILRLSSDDFPERKDLFCEILMC